MEDEQLKLEVKGLEKIAKYDVLRIDYTMKEINNLFFNALILESSINRIDEHNQSPFNNVVIAQDDKSTYLVIGSSDQNYKTILEENSVKNETAIVRGVMLNGATNVSLYPRDSQDRKTYLKENEIIKEFIGKHGPELEKILEKEVGPVLCERKVA